MIDDDFEDKLYNFFGLNWNLYKNKLSEINTQLEEVSYNIISVSTYSGHLENYHSDVWGFLLDSTAPHKKDNQFLDLFIEYLMKYQSMSNENIGYLKDAKVYREKGRIDVLIVNKKENKCIILENKINNAPDMHNQLGRYKVLAQKQGWDVLAMLYVTPTGGSLSTLENGNVISIAAANNQPDSLLNGWLFPCRDSVSLDTTPTNKNARSFIHQYCMLLQHLTAKNLSNMSNKIMYEYLSDKNNFETALLIEKELENIKLYRLEIFEIALRQAFNSTDYFKPFLKKTFYSPNTNALIFENYNYQGNAFKLGIYHYKNRTEFTFFNSNNKMDIQQLKTFLNEILGSNEFSVLNGALPNHLKYIIQLDSSVETLPELDKAVIEYSIGLFRKFDEFTKRNKLNETT